MTAILIADDDPDIRDLVASAFRRVSPFGPASRVAAGPARNRA